MRWNNPGNEVSKAFTDFEKKWPNKTKVYIFGAGKVGAKVADSLIRFECLMGIIDNDQEKQNERLSGYEIISLDDYLKKRDGCIVVCVGKKYRKEITDQLQGNGLVENLDFYQFEQFENDILADLLFYAHNVVFVRLAQISLTERCTLKCKKCAHGCYAVPNSKKDLALSTVYESADMFFSVVDYIEEFVLIGGEPFLYKDIPAAISYIGDRYRNKIGIFSITTNGTIVPRDEILTLCKQYDVTIRISNYQDAIPNIKKQHQKLQEKCDAFGVTNYLGSLDHNWMDYGFDHLERHADEETLIRVFDECATPCREIRGSKYYFCVMARTVAENLGFNVGKEDYLDIRAINGDKRLFFEYNKGFSKKGYLDMCNYCYGAEAAKHLIPVAEQL